jgi:hypothetical protein
VGVVAGSVSITSPKNKSGQEVKRRISASSAFALKYPNIKRLRIAVKMKTKNIFTFATFFNIRKPKIRTGSRNHDDPTHQITPAPKNDPTVSPTAAGLNICCFLIIKTYLDEMAIIETRPKIKYSCMFPGGRSIRNRISAVIR